MILNRWLCIFLLCWLPMTMLHAQTLTQRWKQSLQGTFVVTPWRDVQKAEALFTQVLLGQVDTQQAWTGLGMVLEQLTYKKDIFIVIREQSQQQYGRGFFVIRQHTASHVLLQAPHTFKDLYTGRIALQLWLAGDAKAAAWNTVPRSYTENGQMVDADLAHRSGTFFLAFSRAFAHHQPVGRTLQLHGFARGKRESRQGQEADFILSSGSRQLNASVQSLARCLKKNISPQTLMYPTEITELGGTRNAIARALDAYAQHRFIHLEMSFEQRRLLRKDKTARYGLLKCL